MAPPWYIRKNSGHPITTRVPSLPPSSRPTTLRPGKSSNLSGPGNKELSLLVTASRTIKIPAWTAIPCAGPWIGSCLDHVRQNATGGGFLAVTSSLSCPLSIKSLSSPGASAAAPSGGVRSALPKSRNGVGSRYLRQWSGPRKWAFRSCF